MSEENNLGTSNLCTTEDAFEQFQAVAMYEEDEFITLSDIVPPQPVVPDLSNELNEIPYDNEVVLSSTLGDDAKSLKNTVESSFDQNSELRKQHLNKTKNNASKTHVTSPKPLYFNESGLGMPGVTNKFQKRGRKKTKSNENHISNQKTLETGGVTTDNPAIQDSVLSTTVGKNGTESYNETQEMSSYPRRTRRERIPNTSKYPLLNSESVLNDSISNKITPVKRRGRSKKVPLENSIISEPDSTNIDNASLVQENLSCTESVEPDEMAKNKTIRRPKRGRPKISLTQTNLKHIDESSHDITENNTNMPVREIKRATRRGRQKLIEASEKPSESIGNSHKQYEGNTDLSELILQSEDNKLSSSEHIKVTVETHQQIDNSIDSDSLKKLSRQGNKKKVIAKCNDINSKVKVEESHQEPVDLDLENDDEADDICLSKLKENFQNNPDNLNDNDTDTVDMENESSENGDLKRHSKVPIMADFEYNIDKIVNEASSDSKKNEVDTIDESLLIEDTSKRPIRRKARQSFKYEEDSDEDPFANIELSDEDDDKLKSRKKGRYTSDDEYVPRKKKGVNPVTSSSDTDRELNDQEGKKQRRKKVLNSDGQSPRKRGRKNKGEMSLNEDQERDIEECKDPSVITEEPLSMKPPAEAWATSNEFENFIAQKIGTNLKIKKVSAKQKTESVVTRLEIPVIDQNEPKKMNETSTQTSRTPVTTTGVQTSVPYDIPMKTIMSLSSEQSEKACEFLNSVVKTTAELGQLMKEKSEHFMNKKINTENVTDTFKMDYCVRKSFLLFKLAKHNLMQMEEDLAMQYDEFLKNNGLSACREPPKNLTPTPKPKKADSDSDCEIVDVKEVSKVLTKKESPKFNPKTVFLNKELSIKIAKKPSVDKNVDITGRHTVWINDSVMVKKVKPTQSFLAQDSRNKKPPDYITEKMVSDFFEDYNRQKAIAVCAPYINAEWSSVYKEYTCHYFVKCNDLDDSDTKNADDCTHKVDNNASTSNGNYHDVAGPKETRKNHPKSLVSLCTEVVCNFLHYDSINEANEDLKCNLTDGKNINQPLTLFRLCIQLILSKLENDVSKKPSILNNSEKVNKSVTVLSLQTLCCQRIAKLMSLLKESSNHFKDIKEHTVGRAVYGGINTMSNEGSLDYKDENIYINEEDLSQHTSVCAETINQQSNQINQIKPSINLSNDSNSCEEAYTHKNGVQSLLSLCVMYIKSIHQSSKKSKNIFVEDIEKLHPVVRVGPICPDLNSPKSLKYIVHESINNFMYGEKLTEHFAIEADAHQTEEMVDGNKSTKDFTINCINTMSEEAFRCLEEPNELQYDYDYEPDIADQNNGVDEDEWASQVQMQELRSCVTPSNNLTANEYCDTKIDTCVAPLINPIENEFIDTNVKNYEQYQNTQEPIDSLLPTTQIKLEPYDDIHENVDSSIVKIEPVHGLDGMTIIPESIVTKSEIIDHGIEAGDLVEKESCSFDVNSFEQFVRTNKMKNIDEYSDSEEIFSQSGLRIRRQHEPDNDAENDMNMSLLIPHTFEPLHIQNAKGDLMESSSDENKDCGAKKTNRKKIERKKPKLKKTKENVKTSSSKEIPPIDKDLPVEPVKEISANLKEKAESINEVAMLTRKMREKIRQEEKKIESSDSETENLYLSLRREKNKKEGEKNSCRISQEEKEIESYNSQTDQMSLSLIEKNMKETEKNKTSKNLKQGEPLNNKAIAENEIQCNNVDSTEQILENEESFNEADIFTGFSATDQTQISNYEKYLKLVYDKIVPGQYKSSHENTLSDIDGDSLKSNRSSPIINPEDPVELIECEPAVMPLSHNAILDEAVKQPKKTISKKINHKQEALEHSSTEKDKLKFTERHGWHCYNFDPKDVKLYKNCHIPLEKLPESFVETYLEYHDITVRDKIDKEVDRLINLQTLNRATSIKEGKIKNGQKGKSSSNEQSVSGQNSSNGSRVPSPANSDCLDELSPSEDEGAQVDDELPLPVPTTENYIAKNSLMDENESDSDGDGTKKITDELNDTEGVVVKTKPGPKSKTNNRYNTLPPNDSLMLTADKMMNKELSLLHAPIDLKEEIKDTSVKAPSPKETKSKKRNSKNVSLRDRFKIEEDSSSEEEKQWVSTKEKLLKRLEKKEDISLDDAKRAKLVDDFIEKRADAPGKRRAAGGRRSKKKFLERLKQQSILSKELCGEPDTLPGGKRGPAAGLFKGRRNIRKVIDKKSLQKSTVLANMEEFERKRRLNSRQNQLRELLGCEEGVNVLVINDEVCLEYDFREQQPVVTVHPFFTKVMKAHQYEGVKFMWDACFESLESIEAGRPGGGCILAHCMGLGKTLQVLALLHTVLTHPRANMHRVLVCCPLSTVLNWVDEIHKWIGPVTNKIKVFELSKLKKTYERAYQLEDWYSGGGIFIIGYELFRSLTTLDPQVDDIRPTIIKKIRTALLDPGPDIVICDEGHLLKNDCSVLAVAMSRVVTRRRIILTGTPMQNNLREYYCMVNFVKPNLLGTYSEYSNRFENPIMNGQHRDSREEDIKLMKARTHILHKVLEGCLQRQEASVLYPYLPKKHEYTVFIPLTKCQWDLYKHYVHHYTKDSRQSVLKDFHILQKIWSHPQVLHNFQMKSREDAKKREIKAEKLEDDLALEDKEDIKPTDTEVWWMQYLADGAMLNSLDSSNKFVAVFRILHECVELGDKVLIFSTSLFCLDALEYFLKQINGWSLGQDYYRLDGSVPPEVRQKWCREYNAENNVKTKLFLISTRAGCLGLNMTAANRVIILDTSWNPAHDIQSIFRVYRFGQKKDCYIYRLVAMGTMEQKIYERSVTKQAVACRVVDEQQIDRHYNMAELTELYRFDEFGSGVAGGVAVGVGDVALLRVARDAAVHAVHEHDSLLRGSGEQGLPEHERAAAWMQFQQEHANKQMQNDLETDLAARALEKVREREQIQRQLARHRAQILNLHTEDGPVHGDGSVHGDGPVHEDGPVHGDLLVPRDSQPLSRVRVGWEGSEREQVVQCRIPIKLDNQPGPSQQSESLGEEEMVRQISDILIKHKFTQSGRGPKQIKDLLTKVKQMIQTGKPMSLGSTDELTANIASVLMQRQPGSLAPAPPPAADPPHAPAPVPAPAPPHLPTLTDVSPEELKRGRGRPVNPPQNEHTPASPQSVKEKYIPDARGRRKAAIAAERQFDLSDDAASQDSVAADTVIDLDDDDWEVVASDTDSATEFIGEPPTIPKLKVQKKIYVPLNVVQKSKVNDNSIVLSDDEPPPVAKPQALQANTTEEIIPLHSSLLSNQNFIKIVAHTYLAGNPMLDEDAATLAAQYSAFRLLKETESTGKPIESGPIYDIAIKVLGKDVLRKLQIANPKPRELRCDSNTVSSKVMQKLGQEAAPKPAPARKPGPKSRVKPLDLQQDKEIPKLGIPQVVNLQQKGAVGIVPVTLMRRSSTSVSAAPPEADECILPDDDDDDVRCITDPAPLPPLVKPKLKLKLIPMEKEHKFKLRRTSPLQPMSAIRVTAGDSAPAAAPVNSELYDTISLDSDEEEPPAAPTPSPAPAVGGTRALRSARQRARAGAEGPVPVALTGPNSQPLPLTLGTAAAPASRPSCSFSSAAPATYTDLVPVSLTAPDARPVPVSLGGPDSRPVPVSLTGPGFQAIPISTGGPSLRAIPASYAATSTPTSLAGAARPGSTPRPTSPSESGMPGAGGMRTIRLGAPAQAGAGATPGEVVHQVASNIYLVPAGAASERLLTRVPASQVPPAQRLEVLPTAAPLASQHKNYISVTNNKAVCQPGDILRLTKTGKLELLRKNNSEVIHTIDDSEPLAQPISVSTNVPSPNALTPNQLSRPPPWRELLSKPAVQSASKSLPSKPAVQPVSKTAPQPVSKPVPQPVSKPAPQSLLKPAPRPVSKPARQPVSKPAPQPVSKSATQPVSKPAPQPVSKSTPQPVSKPATQPLSNPTKTKQERSLRSRKISSSSSSSSGSSRSPSPDPLSILKDVVHIQAPKRQRSKVLIPTSKKQDISIPKQPSKADQGSSKVTLKPIKKTTSSNEKEKHKDNAIAQKLNNFLASVKLKQSLSSVGKSKPGKCAQNISKAKSSKASVAVDKNFIDLTELTFKPAKPLKCYSKGKSSTSKKDCPTTVTEKTKDVKSKSLTNKSMVDETSQKSLQVTNAMLIPPGTSKQKRPAPSTEPTAPKKKKTELMMLKDFDLDDIDDIIELD